MNALKLILWIVVLASVGTLSWLAWTQYDRAIRAGEVAEEALARADSAEAASRLAEERATEWRVTADSLDAALQREAEVVRERERILEEHADSLASEISGLVPPGEVRDQVEAAVQELRLTYEERLDDLHELLGVSMAQSATLRGELMEREQVIAHLRIALEAERERSEAFRRALDPGWLERLKQSVAALSGAVAVGAIIVLILG